MSKGGRGRGRGNVSFNMEAIGFGRGDALPKPTLHPPPKYPPLRQLSIPLLTGDETNYMLALKKEYLQTMQNSPYYIKAEQEKNDVDRYSDKYRTRRNIDNSIEWKPDWRRLPKELKIAVRKKKRTSKIIAPNLSTAKNVRKGEMDISKKLDDLAQKDHEVNEKTSDKEEAESDNEEVDDIIEHDEDEEEENDYLTSYFDNGESYLDEDDDTLDDKEGGIY